MTPLDIKYSLSKRGLSQTDVADSLGVSVVSVHLVISGERTSHRIATHIASALDKTIDEIWPGRYDDSLRRAA